MKNKKYIILALLICCSSILLGNEPSSSFISTDSIEKITKQKMKEKKAEIKGNKFSIFSWAKDISGEILVFYLPDAETAKKEARKFLMLIEAGRTNKGKNIKTSDDYIGDFCITPKKITNDPHGFDMKDSNKTFLIFTRNNVLVIVDSKKNFSPNIDVHKIAKEIDGLLKTK